MKLKLDENFDVRLVPELLKEGFDVDTVIAEGLAGSPAKPGEFANTSPTTRAKRKRRTFMSIHVLAPIAR